MDKRGHVAFFCLALFFLWTSAAALLSPKGVNYEGEVTRSRVLPSFPRAHGCKVTTSDNYEADISLLYMQFKL